MYKDIMMKGMHIFCVMHWYNFGKKRQHLQEFYFILKLQICFSFITELAVMTLCAYEKLLPKTAKGLFKDNQSAALSLFPMHT